MTKTGNIGDKIKHFLNHWFPYIGFTLLGAVGSIGTIYSGSTELSM